MRLLSLSLPAVRALAAMSIGKKTQREMTAFGVAQASVSRAIEELIACGLCYVVSAGRAASARQSARAGLFCRTIGTEQLPPFLCQILQLANRSQARVLLALHVFASDPSRCAKVVAQRANVSYDSARAALAQCRQQGWVEADSYELTLTERYEKHDSAIKNTTAQCFVAPQKSLQQPISDPSDSFKTELKTVSETVKTTTTAVVSELLKAGIARHVAIELANKYEKERIFGVIKKSETASNRGGYIFNALTKNYDFSRAENKVVNSKTKYEDLKINDLSMEQKKRAQDDFDRDFAIFNSNSNTSH